MTYILRKHQAHKLYRKNVLEVLGKIKLESSLKTELDEALSLGSKVFIKKNHQLQQKQTLRDYNRIKNTLKKNLKKVYKKPKNL